MKKKLFNKHTFFLFVLLAVMIALPTSIAIFYALPGADDYSFVMQFMETEKKVGSIQALFVNSYNIYTGWQGTYTTNFLVSLLKPYTSWGIIGLRLSLLASFLFFAFSLYFCGLWMIQGTYRRTIKNYNVMFLVIEATVLNMFKGTELFFWFTGACAYTIPLSIGLIGIGLYASYLFQNKRKYFGGSIICGFIAAGGSLQITALICWTYLIICFVFILRNKSNSLRYFINRITPFMITVAGAFINVLAPGNTVRQSGQIYVRSALVNSVYVVADETKSLFENYAVGVSVIFVFLFSLTIVTEERKTLKKLFLILCSGYGAAYISTFPVLLGYNTDTLSSLRTAYVCDFIISISVIYCAYGLGVYLKNVKKMSLSPNVILSIICSVLIVIAVGNGSNVFNKINNGMTVRIVQDLKNGNIQRVENTYMSIYEKLETSAGKDVRIKEKGLPDTVLYMPKIYDSTWWVNQTLASYYGVKSLDVEWDDGNK